MVPPRVALLKPLASMVVGSTSVLLVALPVERMYEAQPEKMGMSNRSFPRPSEWVNVEVSGGGRPLAR